MGLCGVWDACSVQPRPALTCPTVWKGPWFSLRCFTFERDKLVWDEGFIREYQDSFWSKLAASTHLGLEGFTHGEESSGGGGGVGYLTSLQTL